jgi:hypothetical protein
MTDYDKWLTTEPEAEVYWIELNDDHPCDFCGNILEANATVLTTADDEHLFCNEKCWSDWVEAKKHSEDDDDEL